MLPVCAVRQFQDINQVISWPCPSIAEDLAFSPLQSHPSTSVLLIFLRVFLFHFNKDVFLFLLSLYVDAFLILPLQERASSGKKQSVIYSLTRSSVITVFNNSICIG